MSERDLTLNKLPVELALFCGEKEIQYKGYLRVRTEWEYLGEMWVNKHKIVFPEIGEGEHSVTGLRLMSEDETVLMEVRLKFMTRAVPGDQIWFASRNVHVHSHELEAMKNRASIGTSAFFSTIEKEIRITSPEEKERYRVLLKLFTNWLEVKGVRITDNVITDYLNELQ